MCFSSRKPQPTPPPAAAPAPPLPPAEQPEIGDEREKENLDNHGERRPSYRVNRQSGPTPKITPSGPISM